MQLKNGYNVIENAGNLPDFSKAKEVFLDIETQNNFGRKESGLPEYIVKQKKKEGGMYPWKGDRICGVAVTADDNPQGYYIPVRHRFGTNISIDIFQRWLKDTLTGCENWINHNINFDAVFAHFDNATFDCKLIDTLTLSKIHDTDRIGHGLKDLGRDWLNYDTGSTKKVQAYLNSIKSEVYTNKEGQGDFSMVPIDILGEYAIDDVFMNRELYRYLQEHKEPELNKIWENEILLTPVLWDMEIQGMQVNEQQLKIERLKCLRMMIDCATRLEELTKTEFTNSNQCIFDILINRLSLPILATIKEKDDYGYWYDTGRPTFDKDAMSLYRVHPEVRSDEKISEIVKLIDNYRTESQFNGLFVEPLLSLKDNKNRVHPHYNQLVRTGRMSCSRPNSQQQNERSKELFHPFEGMGFISNDYSQIEYRFIVHYIKDPDAIKAYNENKKTDFHQWVANLLHVQRKAGKTLNFGMAYGAGKKRVTAGLISNPDIIEEIGTVVTNLVKEGKLVRDKMTETFKMLCAQRASEVYEAYHERLPGIKRTAKECQDACKWRGYVFNLYGRRRHLPPKACRKAFNSIVQGGAMDVMKESMIKLSPRYNDRSKKIGLLLSANVHDEILDQVPKDLVTDKKTHLHIIENLENPSIPLLVPVSTDTGISFKNWSEARKEDPIYDNNENWIGGGMPDNWLD